MTMVRVALTETANQHPLPKDGPGLDALTADELEAIRRANVDHHLELLAEAAARGAQLVCFGELFAAPYFAISKNPVWLGLAEPVDGATVRAVAAAAREHEVDVIAPIYERDGDRRFNTAVFISRRGETLGRYRKVHVPHGQNEQASFFERDYYGDSDGVDNPHAANVSSSRYFPVFDLGYAKVGCCICYDRHFEGVVGALARQGAEVVLCPAVTFGAKSRRMWELEFEVDAARHRVFIGGSNRRGTESPWNQEYFGGSYFVGPNGRLPNRSEHEKLVIADLPLELLRAPDPSGWQLQGHRRDPAVYE